MTDKAAGVNNELPGDNFIELHNVTFSYAYIRDNNADRAESGAGADTGAAAVDCGAVAAGGASAKSAISDSNVSVTPGGDVYDRDKAIEDVSLGIRKGQFIVFLGRNGSGKSTLAKHLNALLIPDSGEVTVKGMKTSDPDNIWEIRRTSGMVFQNPDNQIVGTTVEEDVAFGVENLGIPPAEIRMRIDASMAATGVDEYAARPPYQLSGGQKQRVAIAGILAMEPECVILDEATAMLDPDGRREVMRLVRTLNKDNNITVILITHHMDEAAFADMVFVVDDGRVAMARPPRELFGDGALIRSIGLDVPQIAEIFEILRERGFTGLPPGTTEVEEAFRALKPLLEKKG